MASASSNHKLVEISRQNWEELRDLFLVEWPEHILGYSIVNNFVEFQKRKGDNVDINHLKFYSLDGAWRNEGAFLVIDRYQLFLYSRMSDTASAVAGEKPRLETALELLDWTNGFKVSSFSAKHRQSVVRVVESKRLEREFDSDTIFYYLPKERALELECNCPNDVVLKPIADADVPLADSLWPNRHSGSLFFLRRQRLLHPTVAAYRQHTDGSEEMMGWCFLLQSGAMGALQVREEWQGRGIGKLLVVAMAKSLAKLEKDSFGFVGPTNVSSRKLFKGLGYKGIDKIYWLRTFAVGKSESIWEGDSEEDLKFEGVCVN